MKKGFWRNRRWILIPVIAVCLCVLAAAGINTLKRLDYNTVIGAPGDGEQSVWLGSISEDKYYYFVEYDGVWSYDLKTGLREKKADTYWIDSWQVNEYGIYYEQGRTFGVIPHDTGKRQVLYKGRWPSCDKLRFKILQDGNVILTELNIGRKIRTEYLLEGRTGELLATVLEPAKYEDIVLSCSEAYFRRYPCLCLCAYT